MFRKIALVAFCAAFSTSAVAYDFKVGGLQIDHPRSFETPPMAMTGGGFMTITKESTVKCGATTCTLLIVAERKASLSHTLRYSPQAAGSHLPDGQSRGPRAGDARKPQARGDLLRKENRGGS